MKDIENESNPKVREVRSSLERNKWNLQRFTLLFLYAKIKIFPEKRLSLFSRYYVIKIRFQDNPAFGACIRLISFLVAKLLYKR